ncbi:MAG TPA: hypothetical protein VII47_06235 [Actinomycetota bacterium]
MTRTDVLASAPLGNSVFELVRDVTPPSSYDSISGASSVRARIGAGDEWTPVDSLPALTRWAANRGVDLAAEVSRTPAVFAEFVAALELNSRALTSSGLYSFVEERFPVLLDRESPRVEGDRLLFVGGRFGLHQDSRIWRVSVDLTSGTVEEEPVPPRPAAPGS